MNVSVDHDIDLIAAEAALMGESRRRMHDRVVGNNDRRSGLLTGGTFLVAVAAWNAFAPPRAVPIGALVGKEVLV